MAKEPEQIFQPFTARHLEALRKLVGADRVLADDDANGAEALETYSHDFTEDLRFKPSVAVLARSAEEVSKVLAFATRERIPVTPRGAGTGLSGAALPVRGGIVLSLGKMNRILEIDTDNLMAVVEPGVITEVLQNAVAEKGLFYPPDPASRGSCMLGGNLSHCAGGPRAVKYGVTKDYVYGVEAVLPTGEIVRHGGKLLKNSTGYNLTQLLIGSEGTLAVITKIFLKLIPMPTRKSLVLAPFDSLEKPAAAVAALFQAGLTPSACEYMEREALEAGCRQTSEPNPFPNATAMLLLEVDGFSDAEIDRQLETLSTVLERFGAADMALADSPERAERLWRIRRSIGEAVKTRAVYKEEDTVVPRFVLPELLKRVKSICAEYGVASVCYGHAGDGNLHVNLLKENLSDDAWNSELPKCITRIFEAVRDLGGTVSGEHGVGYVQRRYLPIVYGPAELALMRAIKRAFDPAGILNPDKTLP
ncbi:MAG: FAD-binding protein [Deltaproteobacteria bacterium]|nr:FAD-binding protein [Deltaproteobacteria bacterium]